MIYDITAFYRCVKAKLSPHYNFQYTIAKRLVVVGEIPYNIKAIKISVALQLGFGFETTRTRWLCNFVEKSVLKLVSVQEEPLCFF